MNARGTLYVVATPIGNLQDITLRAIDTLKKVDVVAAEDTRHTAGLLSHLGINKKQMAVHEHNEQQAAQQIVSRLSEGENIALVSDAGTPGISDPGAIVVDAVHSSGLTVVPVPGASAVVTAMSAAGIAKGAFSFIGFLPASGSQRRKQLTALQTLPQALVFYEAPHRIVASVADMAATLGETRQIIIARELTKTYETIHRCALSEASAWLEADSNQQRGEFVLIIEAPAEQVQAAISDEAEQTLKLLLAELPLKQAVKLATVITGAKKNELYQHALILKNQTES